MRARYYMPDLMRFINQDIVTGDISNGGSLNRYTYVEGNPATMIDPFGLCPSKRDMFSEIGVLGISEFYRPNPYASLEFVIGAVRGVARAYDIVSGVLDVTASAMKGLSDASYEALKKPSSFVGIAPMGGIGLSYSYSGGALSVNPEVAFGAVLVVPMTKVIDGALAVTTDLGSNILSYGSSIMSENANQLNKIADDMSSYVPNNKSGSQSVTVEYNGSNSPVYRGGNDFTINPNEVKIDINTGNVKTTHGVSINVDPNNVSKFGGAYKVENIPNGLRIVQRGAKLEHFEIVPEYEMSLDMFQKLLNQIELSGPY